MTGTALLIRQALGRDRFLVPAWIAILTLTCYASAAATSSLYPTVADQVRAAEGINASPAIIALYGPILDVDSLGELAMTKMTVLYALFVAVMCIVVVRRHTRGEEESGRLELVGGTAVARTAPFMAAVAVGAMASIALGILAAAANIIGGLPVSGSVLFAASWTGVGLVSVGVAATACQLSASSRTCTEIAAAIIGSFYVLRAVGDSTETTWLSWLSPFGWSTQLSAWSAPRIWVLLLFPALAAVLLGAATVLQARRDLDAGVLAARAGPRSGSPRLRNVVSLTMRLNAPSLLVWTVATAVLAIVFGAIVPQFDDLLDSPSARAALERIGGAGALDDTVFAAVISVVTVVLTAFGVSVVNHSATDERSGRTELVLATGTSRQAAFWSTALVAIAGMTWLLLVTGAALTLGYTAAGGSPGGELVAACLAQAPAGWLVLALTVLAWACRTAWSVVGWVLLALFLSLGQLGELLDQPRWVTGISPYSHSASMPAQAFDPGAAILLTVLACLGLLVAARRHGRRDLG
ncbi:ABC transporter permease [Aeromicrobium sp. UC242_57]|uniref:ABC transporter permease n=1 Tax=Aeromicrobium sp. UC242_57 TaxID=3374624 RepID=UPI00379A7622